jgi:N-acetylated-alpha-linked acidic dipeptidase
MPFGSWYKSLYASSDPYSGYASWMMPAFKYELSQKSTTNLKMWEEKYIHGDGKFDGIIWKH